MKDALRQSVRPIVSARPNRTGPARRNDAAETRHAALQSMMNTAPTVQRLAALQRVANGGKSVADTSLQRIEDEEDLLQGKMMQRQSDEEDLLQGKMIQRQEDDDDLMQGKMIQREAMDDADPLQGKALQRRETGGQGGLPGPLRAGIEQLSGLSMEGVRVHRNSTAPAVVGAHAYAQGRDIHLGPGQEQHLPHEAWHVVQQAQGRVRRTIQAKGVAINDDAGLEKEADLMGLAASHLATLEADPSPRSGRANTQVPGTVPTPFVRATPSLAKSRTASPSLFLQPASRSVLSTGTVQKQDKVINYGSGTSPETLMQSENEHVPDIDVTSVDTGHMLLAEIIQLNLVNDKREGIGGILDDLLKAYNLAKGKSHAGWKDLVTSARENDLSWMKKQYFPTVVGFRGVLKQVERMGTKAQEFFNQRKAKLDEDDSFQIGDSSALPENGQFDTIYCINGYGYSPLTDPGIFGPMAKTLKKGGELVIISEVMGPTAEPFLKFSRQDRKSLEGLFVMTRKEDVITENPDPRATMNIITKEFVRHVLSDNEPLARAFALTETNPQTVAAEEFFKPDLSASTIYLDKSSALGWNPLTTTMQSRHTEGGGELDENIHVRLVFRKK